MLGNQSSRDAPSWTDLSNAEMDHDQDVVSA